MAPLDDLKKEFEYMHHRLRKCMEQLSLHRMSGCLEGKSCWIPSADIHETEEAYHVFVDLAGIDPSSIELEVEGNILRVNGERNRPRVESCTRIHQLEIDVGSFKRIFQFPLHLDSEGAQSSYRHGFLEIILPKLQRPVHVQVQVPLRRE